jgi:hypothetical protein
MHPHNGRITKKDIAKGGFKYYDVPVNPVRKGRALTHPPYLPEGRNKEPILSISTIPIVNAWVF